MKLWHQIFAWGQRVLEWMSRNISSLTLKLRNNEAVAAPSQIRQLGVPLTKATPHFHKACTAASPAPLLSCCDRRNTLRRTLRVTSTDLWERCYESPLATSFHPPSARLKCRSSIEIPVLRGFTARAALSDSRATPATLLDHQYLSQFH